MRTIVPLSREDTSASLSGSGARPHGDFRSRASSPATTESVTCVAVGPTGTLGAAPVVETVVAGCVAEVFASGDAPSPLHPVSPATTVAASTSEVQRAFGCRVRTGNTTFSECLDPKPNRAAGE